MQTQVNSVEINERKFGVSYGWISPVVRKRSAKVNCFKLLIKNFKLYCKYCSLVGFKYFAECDTTWIERIFWILVHAVTLWLLTFLIRNAYNDSVNKPFGTSVDADYYPMEKLEFPGVAICTINRISARVATEMATEIANTTDMNLDEVLDAILQLGDIYKSAVMIDDEYTTINELLSKFYGDYDITDIMKRLTPECSATLLTCYFRGERQNCSKIFAFRKTHEGYCCTFNYVVEEDDVPEITEESEASVAERVEELGIENGLSVVMEPHADDYFYSIHPIIGWKAMIFNSRDYPDVASGGTSEVLISPRTEMYVEIDAVMIDSTKDTLSYPVTKRGCFFKHEILPLEHSNTYSDCIDNCKLEDLWKACNCRPFFYPRRGQEQYSKRVCDLTDIECLNKYNSQWITVMLHEDTRLDDTAVTNTTVLHCQKCYPPCDDVSYIVKTSVSFMEPGVHNTTLLQGVDVANQSILHVYFTKLGAVVLKQDVIYRWYEFLSDFGGICGVFIGISLISVIELIYFGVHTLFELWNGSACVQAMREDEIEHRRKPIQTIYWSELLPRSRINAELGKSRNICRE